MGHKRIKIIEIHLEDFKRRQARGVSERFSRAQQMEHRIQILLEDFAAIGALPLEFKPPYSVGDLLPQHLDELEQGAERKGGALQALADHFSRIYKAPIATLLAA